MNDTIRIGSLGYQVIFEPDLIHQGYYGKVTHSEGIIRVRPGMTQEHEFLILWHEILHAIIDNNGLDTVLGDNEEQFVKALAFGVTQVLMDNPRVRCGAEQP